MNKERENNSELPDTVVPIEHLIHWLNATPEVWESLVGSEFYNKNKGWLTLTRVDGNYLKMSVGTFVKSTVVDYFDKAKIPLQIAKQAPKENRQLQVEKENADRAVAHLRRFAVKNKLSFSDLNKAYDKDSVRFDHILKNLRDRRAIIRSDAGWLRKNLSPVVFEHLPFKSGVELHIGCSHREIEQGGVNYTGQFRVLYFDDYYPKRIAKDHEASRRLLRFKEGEHAAVVYYSGLVEKCIRDQLIVCCAPSSRKGRWGSGLLKLSELISEQTECTAVNDLIIRTEDTEKKSLGGKRNVGNDLLTMRITDPIKCKDKSIVIFDDIITTGTTMKACADLLWGAGAAFVTCIVMGNTIDTRFRANRY